tara:strand:- start:192 stop:413 length:222 start_codon:yes stop_codon:yes gene_type:complete
MNEKQNNTIFWENKIWDLIQKQLRAEKINLKKNPSEKKYILDALNIVIDQIQSNQNYINGIEIKPITQKNDIS